jgi:uncharacterized protein YjiS (DUF1127 family)
MRKIRDVLRLKFESGLTERVIARSMSLSNGSVNSYLQRARMAGLRWPLPVDLDDGALERLLFPPAATAEAARARPRASIKFITEKLAARRRYREVVRELSQMSDHELCDIGIHRCDIESIARQTVAA